MAAGRPDTSASGRFGGQWAFLSQPLQHEQPRSVPASSYIRSDKSNSSPLPTGQHSQTRSGSRSSLPRNIYAPSAGGHSAATIPSQPVLIRVHSADASAHLRPASRQPRSRPLRRKDNGLPSIEEFSIKGILAAIEEDIEGDINAISEILGRSRLVLADQHDSHLPPQGEIRATNMPLQAVEEASASTERLAADDVLIMREDASLVGGSHAGSAAYGLLERLQAVPRARRMNSDLPIPTTAQPPIRAPVRNNSSPAVLTDTSANEESRRSSSPRQFTHGLHHLLRAGNEGGAAGQLLQCRTTNPVVCETHMSAGAGGRTFSDPPIVHEAGRQYPLYSYDESEIFESPANDVSVQQSLQTRVQRLLHLTKLQNLLRQGSTVDGSAICGADVQDSSPAENRLRNILTQQPQRSRPSLAQAESVHGGHVPEPELYD